jgi:hypothetical protein
MALRNWHWQRDNFRGIRAKAADTQPAPALRVFQEQHKVPAVQLTAEGDTYKRFPNGSQEVLIAPASMWVPRLG